MSSDIDKTINNIGYSDAQSDSDYTYTLGDILLQENIIDVTKSAINNKLSYYSENEPAPNSIYDININQQNTMDKEVVDINTVESSQKKYDDLTYDNMAELMDVGYEYRYLNQTMQRMSVNEELDGGVVFTYTTVVGVTSSGRPIEEERTTTIAAYRTSILWKIGYQSDVIEAGLTERVKSSPDIESAFNLLKDNVIRERNRVYNQKLSQSNKSDVAASYQFNDILTQAEYDDMDSTDKIIQTLTVGSGAEHIYRYSYDFWFSLIFLLTVAIAIILATFKLGTVLFDIIVTQLLAGVIAATGVSNSGRTKLVVQNLVSSYVIFVVIAFILKVYIKSILIIHNMSDLNYITQLILIACFAKGVISCPDFITRVLGIDAGNKNAIGSVYAISSVARGAMMGGAAVRGVAKRASGATAGTVTGFATGGYSSFKNARNNGHGKIVSTMTATVGVVTGGVAGSVRGYKAGGVFNAIKAATVHPKAVDNNTADDSSANSSTASSTSENQTASAPDNASSTSDSQTTTTPAAASNEQPAEETSDTNKPAVAKSSNAEAPRGHAFDSNVNTDTEENK